MLNMWTPPKIPAGSVFVSSESYICNRKRNYRGVRFPAGSQTLSIYITLLSLHKTYRLSASPVMGGRASCEIDITYRMWRPDDEFPTIMGLKAMMHGKLL